MYLHCAVIMAISACELNLMGIAVFTSTINKRLESRHYEPSRHTKFRYDYFIQAEHLVAGTTAKVNMSIGMMLIRATMVAECKPGDAVIVHYFMNQTCIFKVFKNSVECYAVHIVENIFQISMSISYAVAPQLSYYP